MLAEDGRDADMLRRATAWMVARGWKQKLAKGRELRQSLLEHGLNGLDVMCRLLPILSRPAHMHLSEAEGRILQVAILAHDVGKEADDFQEYLTGRRSSASHIDPERTRQVVPAVCEALGFEDMTSDVMLVIEDCINAHHPSPASILRGILHGTSRWWVLAQIVMAVDHLCSAADLHAARDELNRGFLRTAVRASYHQVVMRGVSTTLLHQATQEAFAASGWIPLLCFANGTLYVTDGAIPVQAPSANDIEAQLRVTIGELLSKDDLHEIVVGTDPRASMLPKPELVDFAHIDTYLVIASRRVRRGTFGKKPLAYRKKAITSYLNFSGRMGEALTDEVIARESARLDAAQPEMVVFKFFKAVTSEEVLGRERTADVSSTYDELLGQGSWRLLQSTSTLDPAKDMARTVDHFWRLPGHRFGVAAAQMEEVEPEQRTRLLITTLSGLVTRALAKSATPSPIEALAQQMAQAFMGDLIAPSQADDPRERARIQIETYGRSKATAGKHVRKAVYLCPMCSRPFDQSEGEPARADFVPNPESHTNRAIAHGPFDRIVICKGCRYERVLLQILIGKSPPQTLVLLPHMNIGIGAGALLVQRVRDFVDAAKATMTGASTSRVTLGLTGLIAGNIGTEPPNALSPEDLVQLLTYRVPEDTRKRHLRELVKALRESYDDDLEQVNDLWDTSYRSWDDAATALMSDEVADSEARRLRQGVLKQFPVLYRVGETPNLLILPLPLPIAADANESDANRALRELYVLLLIGLAFDVAVVAMGEGESVQLAGGEGVARVPAIPAVRALIGKEWIQIDEAPGWVQRIGAAAQLGRACKFSPRSDLLQVLTASPPERLLARLDQAQAEHGGANFSQMQLIEILRGAMEKEAVG